MQTYKSRSEQNNDHARRMHKMQFNNSFNTISFNKYCRYELGDKLKQVMEISLLNEFFTEKFLTGAPTL